MGKRTFTTTRDYIETVALPDYGPTSKYAVIPHKEIIEISEELLGIAGIKIDKVLFKSNMGGDVVRAVYHLEGSSDPEMDMMFAWVNSYDKSKRFQCTIGAHIKACGGYWINGDMGNFYRKHTGSAKVDATAMMTNQINNAGGYYTTLINNKNEMKLVILPERLRAELLGRILYEKNLINIEQASIVKTALIRPETDYNADKDSLWTLSCNINMALKKSHPRDWLSKQISISEFINTEFGIGQVNKPDPNQVSLLDSIQEIENKPEAPPEITFDL